jgi:valyl-tRNA synthetase
MTASIPETARPVITDAEIYDRWLASGGFTAHAKRSRRVGGDKDPFVIVMPPPNVTAVLHVGHSLGAVVQDVLIRWRRMAGDDTLWVPGTDHAGIATQNIIEKQLMAEGSSRQALGREAFVARTTAWVAETGGTILQQLRAVGASADWTRTRYTLSPELSRAVREAFVRLYDEGLIYRGHRVIHWCPRDLTSLSDEEAEHEETKGQLYYVRYPLHDDPSRAITVATTRPETMLGDVAVAVHPADERYRDFIGKELTLPLVGVGIPVIADEAVDPTFGTGAVKVTPAHDPNDFEIGQRHNLPMPVIMTPDAKMDGERVPDRFRGLDRFDARAAIVAELRERGALTQTKEIEHAVRHCYRCDTIVEPRLSDQWFVRMKPLAERALHAWRQGALRILPERYEKVYENWLEGIRDWNISRQLWWGHRIPVFYCDACGWYGARKEDPTSCPACAATGQIRQDEDVLDTWFSSWLWPMSTLGWPDDTPDLRAFYPTDVLVSAPEILFFWIARMVMSGLHFMGRVPFHTILLTGTVRDTQHRKMSKSYGNGIDPLDVVQLFGADALRYTQLASMGIGTDIILDPNEIEESFAPGRNFVTKLKNIARALERVGPDDVRRMGEFAKPEFSRADCWILCRLDAAIGACDAALGPARPERGIWTDNKYEGLRLNEYVEAARTFVWDDFAAWYLEHCKARLAPDWDMRDRAVARAILVHVFDMALRLLHPIVPFVTESLWEHLPTTDEHAILATSRWPTARDGCNDGKRATEYERVREAVSALRQLRADYNVPPRRVLDATIVPTLRSRTVYVEEAEAVGRLADCNVRVGEANGTLSATAVLSDGSSVVLSLAGAIDAEKECARFQAELAKLSAQLESLRKRLANEKFVQNARPDVVEDERRKEREWTLREEELARKVRALCGT